MLVLLTGSKLLKVFNPVSIAEKIISPLLLCLRFFFPMWWQIVGIISFIITLGNLSSDSLIMLKYGRSLARWETWDNWFGELDIPTEFRGPYRRKEVVDWGSICFEAWMDCGGCNNFSGNSCVCFEGNWHIRKKILNIFDKFR